MKDEEGTLFSVVPQLNITTHEDFQSFFKELFSQTLSAEGVEAFTNLYSQDPAEGSSYDTRAPDAIGLQYKCLAAAARDYTFEAGRRDLLNYTYDTQKVWTYQQEYSLYLLTQLPLLKSNHLPILGSFHVSDVVLDSFGTIPKDLVRILSIS